MIDRPFGVEWWQMPMVHLVELRSTIRCGFVRQRFDEQDVIGLLRDYTAKRERESAAVPQADGAP